MFARIARNQHKALQGFTILEILIALMIFGILTTGMMLSTRPPRVTAAQEAERLVRFLQNATWRADRTHRNFYIPVPAELSNGLEIRWRSGDMLKPALTFRPSRGITLTYPDQLSYTVRWQRFVGATIMIQSDDGSTYYVIVSLEGRIRMDNKPPSNWK